MTAVEKSVGVAPAWKLVGRAVEGLAEVKRNKRLQTTRRAKQFGKVVFVVLGDKML